MGGRFWWKDFTDDILSGFFIPKSEENEHVENEICEKLAVFWFLEFLLVFLEQAQVWQYDVKCHALFKIVAAETVGGFPGFWILINKFFFTFTDFEQN